ncbi:MAG: site-2 protease family protein [Candidatus Magasanikiibacteriota bacterium]
MEYLPLLFFFVIIIPSAIIHEYAHGWMADQLGDPTARYAGRLSLDPRVHIDKWGTLLMPLLLFLITGGKFLFAYAKPVPYNPYNLKNQKWGPALVAIAGPASNLALALVFGLLVRFMPLTSQFMANLVGLISVIVYANVLLAVFNLVPIPPLDGSKILYAVLPDSQYKIKMMLEQYGFVILLAFIFFGFRFIQPIIQFIYLLITGGVGFF